jgi:curli biogenesis system outer membrane secretion channel CsgG
MNISAKLGAMVMASALLTACGTTTVYENAPPRQTNYRDVQSPSAAGGIGVNANDVVSMTDDMMRDLMTSGLWTGRDQPPRVMISSSDIRNESSARINKNVITENLMNNLIRVSHGRVIFFNRDFQVQINKERKLKREGVVDSGTIRLAQATSAADYLLTGKITSMDQVNTQTGVHDRTYFFTFQLYDAEMGVPLYALGPYSISKFGADNVVYR